MYRFRFTVLLLLAGGMLVPVTLAQAQAADGFREMDALMTVEDPEGEAIEVMTQAEIACPTYALHYDYSGWINLATDQWSFEPGDPVEVGDDYDANGDLLGLALLRIDMKHYTEAQVTVYYSSDPVGWIMNLGNSETNNGCGGDYGTSSFDGELWVVRPPAPPHPPFDYDLGVETNDFGYLTFPWGQGRAASLRVRHLLEEDDGPTQVTYLIKDGSLEVISSKCHPEDTPEISFYGLCVFRIDTGLGDPEADDGCNDGVLWLGLNRVVDGSYRSGQGAEFAVITLIGSGPPPDDQDEETE